MADLKKNECCIPEELLWLMDDQDLQSYLANRPTSDPCDMLSPVPEKIFEKSGYAIIKDSWDASSNYLCFDFGPIATG